MKGDSVKWLLLIFYGVLAAMGVIAVLYFVWSPVHSTVDNAFAYASGFVENSGIASKIGSFTTANLTTLIPLVVTGVGAGIAYLKYHATMKANEKLIDQQKQLVIENMNASSINEGANKQIESLTKQVEGFNSDTTATALQHRISEMQTELENTKNQLAFQINQTEDVINKKTVTPEQITKLIEEVKKVK